MDISQMVKSPIEVRSDYILNSIAKGGAFVNYHNWFYLFMDGVYITENHYFVIWSDESTRK
jgi:hypothetical protein